MAYITQADLSNVIDVINLGAMVDDYATNGTGANGSIAGNQLTILLQMASDAADSLVSSIYAVPFNPPPAKIKQAALIFAAEMLYQRRLTPAEVNPMKSQADYWRKELMMVNSGELSLDNAYRRVVPAVVYTATPSRIGCNGTIF